jgi:hypothetical protein
MSLLSRSAVQAARAYGLLAGGNTVSADYLVVAGGGAGGGGWSGGGGGAGGLLTNTTTLSTLNTYSITVGAGGIGSGGNGSNSSLSGTGLITLTAIGGGGGVTDNSGSNGNNGGSGGGGGYSSGAGGTGVSGQGNNGGTGSGWDGGAQTVTGGGGGGAGAAGANGVFSNAGDGGIGVQSSISGTATYYAGGGGGGGAAGASNSSPGGLGGGGAGGVGANVAGTAGTANTGGGGGGFGRNSGTGANGGSGIVIIAYTSTSPKFTGGTITTSGGKQIHTFTSSGTLSPLTPVTASYLVVAGGGGAATNIGGGGGAGGLLTSSTTLYSGATYVVTVGAGGSGGSGAGDFVGSNGSNSILSGTGLTTITATGGGGGGRNATPTNAGNGGSGGGSGEGSSFGTGTSGQGNNGGTAFDASGAYGAGGGGGASAVGANGSSSSGGNGGAGTASSITGTSVTYAGGGGGGGIGTVGSGGAGGGGNANATSGGAGTSGTTNLGGGGGAGGGSYGAGGSGGSGIVIISYAGSQKFNGGLITTSGGNTIHTFISSGALTPLTTNLNNSLRFRSSASAYLSRTPTVAGNRRTWTMSMWFKLGALPTTDNNLYRSSSDAGANQIWAYFNSSSSNALTFGIRISSTNYQVTLSPLYRDPSAWYHLVWAVDTTQATDSNRSKIYINGQQVTNFQASSYPPQNSDTSTNSTGQHSFASTVTGGGYFDGYMTEINFIDGQALEPYYFGNNDANGVWKPIQYKGTYGTNGFYLTFGNTTSTTTLGYDTSGNNNNWTTNNISLTAGSTYDAMKDVPTNTSATVANYCTLNPLESFTNPVPQQANLYFNGADYSQIKGTFWVSTGKWYFEWVSVSGSLPAYVGVSNASITSNTNVTTSGISWYGHSNSYYKNFTGTSLVSASAISVGDIIGVAFDCDAGTVAYYKNNTLVHTDTTLTPNQLVAPTLIATFSGGGWSPAAFNFGQRPFAYTPPTGFVALNTFNLPTPTILQGNKYMDATLYTGTGAGALTVTNAGQFKPDLVWAKSRNTASQNNVLVDSVRGASIVLSSNLTDAEQALSSINPFNSNGFGANGLVANGYAQNVSGQTYVGWQWQAGQGSTSSNTSGSITSTVSVNTTAGFSIVTYTGTGANATVGHGLGVAPRMIIAKGRGNADNWPVYHASANASPATGHLLLNTTATFTSTSTTWNNTAPTSTVFTVGTDTRINQNTIGYVAYCWAEIAGFSRFGSYTGNGSTDGPFVYLGFRPKFILARDVSVSGQEWTIYDTSRSVYNQVGNKLSPDLNAVESVWAGPYDILSNGFKLRTTDIRENRSASTFIYAAFAEHPFKNANAR